MFYTVLDWMMIVVGALNCVMYAFVKRGVFSPVQRIGMFAMSLGIIGIGIVQLTDTMHTPLGLITSVVLLGGVITYAYASLARRRTPPLSS